ncbi:MAG: DUF2184 domain-containing protein [Clostridia bacterium]|nr:DUF2184 domain-containing protein [Clostridia bacterium]
MVAKDIYKHKRYDAYDEKVLRGSSLLHAVDETITDVGNVVRYDGGEMGSVFFARQLDYIKKKTYDVQYAELNAFKCFPVSSDANEGANRIVYQTYDMTGEANIIKDYADDLPRADVQGKESSVAIKSIGESYVYSVQEMRAARYQGIPLDAKKGTSARKAIDRKINRIAWAGDSEYELYGILSPEQEIPLYAVPEGTSGYTDWRHKTPDEILDDINGMVAAVSYLTHNVEKPDTLLVPADVFIYLSTTRIPNTEAITILTFLQRNNPYIKSIEGIDELSSNSPDTNPYAADGKAVALLYTKDPDKLTLEIPMMFYQHPVQPQNLTMKVLCEARVAGVLVYYPMSAMIAVGI